MMGINTKNLTDSTKKNKFSLKRELSLQFKRIKSFGHKVIFNIGIQRLYELMQRQARQLGYIDGDEIPDNILYNPIAKGKE